jgi:hypothetical protein
MNATDDAPASATDLLKKTRPHVHCGAISQGRLDLVKVSVALTVKVGLRAIDVTPIFFMDFMLANRQGEIGSSHPRPSILTPQAFES